MITKKISLTITEDFHSRIFSYLFSMNSSQAFIFGLSGKACSKGQVKYIVHKLFMIDNDFQLAKGKTNAKSDYTFSVFSEANERNLSVFVVHRSNIQGTDPSTHACIHDNFYLKRSELMDNNQDIVDIEMQKDGRMRGTRIGRYDLQMIDHIQIVGDMVDYFFQSESEYLSSDSDNKNSQTLGPKTVQLLKRMKIGVVGCSGTGSPVIEQLLRLGVGKIVIVDPDVVEHKNLNRILNSTEKDAETAVPKINLFTRLACSLGRPDQIVGINENLYDSLKGLQELSTCDFLFGCVDSVDGRHLLNLVSTFYCIPYFDLGVKIVADGKGGIDKICGSVIFIRPGGPSLYSMGVYNIDELASAGLKRVNPEEFQSLLEEKYIKNVHVESPAVISVNLNIAGAAINEFLCRIHKIRNDSMSEYATLRVCISDGYSQYERTGPPDAYLAKFIGLGNRKPMLNLPELNFDTNEMAEIL